MWILFALSFASICYSEGRSSSSSSSNETDIFREEDGHIWVNIPGVQTPKTTPKPAVEIVIEDQRAKKPNTESE